MIRQDCSTVKHLATAGLVLASLHFAPVQAAGSRHAAPPDMVADFRALATQRPWTCATPDTSARFLAAPDSKAQCAWQNRLRKQSWSWNGDVPGCLSQQARWWSWAQAALPPGTPRSVWDRRWTQQALQIHLGEEQRLLVLQRDGEQHWVATEWRWDPNPRPATHRWQEGRWKLLLDAASHLQTNSASAEGGNTARLRTVFRRVLGARAGEFGPDGMMLESGGQCLHASNPLPGQAKLPLSYNPNDSRLEQRAAMHLQLSRLYPDADWLTEFKLLPMPDTLPSGAKFLATWIADGAVNSQLWMPAKGDATTVRVRMSAPLPHGKADAAAATRIKHALEQELQAIAVQWAAAYE